MPAPKNVLLITADQWRGDCLSAVAHPVVRTPTLDALAAEGTLFLNHYANAVPCGPSRACLHTGMYLHNHRSCTNGTPLDQRFTNWALEARKLGYEPALFGYTHTAADPRGVESDDPRLTTDEGLLPGIVPVVDMATHCGPWRDWLKSLGYALPDDHGMTYGLRSEQAEVEAPRPSLFDARHTDTYFLTQRAIDWMSEAERTATRDNSPGWIAHLSLRAPHPPWVAAAPYHRRYSPSSLPAPRRHPSPDREATLHPWLEYHLTTGRNQSHADDHRHRLLQASYYGLMSEVDTNLGRLFAHLRELKADEHTLVIFTSDHGEQMGDHWLYGKAGFFESSYHIPMIVRVPRGRGGQRVSAFTEHVDVMPTLLQWIGASVPRQCDGESLLTFLRGEPTPSTWRTAAHWEYDFRDPAIEAALGLSMEQCNLNVVRTRQAKYVHFARLSPLLFDLERDPHELTNAIESPGYEKRYGELRSRLSAELLSWRMQHTDKTLSHVSVTREAGLQVRG